jgi:hypothetical protein
MGKDEDQMRVGMIALKSSRLRAAKYARKEVVVRVMPNENPIYVLRNTTVYLQ